MGAGGGGDTMVTAGGGKRGGGGRERRGYIWRGDIDIEKNGGFYCITRISDIATSGCL